MRSKPEHAALATPDDLEIISPSSQVGRYRDVRPSQVRGLQEWFEADDGWNDLTVSVVPVDAVGSDPAQLRGLQAATRVDHASIARPHRLLRSTDTWFLVSDCVRGETLEETVVRGGPLPADRLEALAFDLFAGLAAVHRAGAAHGNIDRPHVVISSLGQFRVVGLGVAAVDPLASPSPEGDLRDAVALLTGVAGDDPLPQPLAGVLEGVAAGDLGAAAARDVLAGPIVEAAEASQRDAPEPSPRAPRPWWVRVLAAALVAMALFGLVLVSTSVLTGGDEGGPPAAVPDVVGMPLASAQTTMERAGFTIDVQLQRAPGSPVGEVLAQEPRGGAEVPRGSRVVLVVATGAEDPP